jgi:hypothetical protein
MSNFTDPLTPTAVQGLKSAGIGHVIVQAVDPPREYPVGRTRDQVQACLDAGLTVDAYVWLWFDLDTDDVQRKLQLLEGLNIRQLWLDVEDTAAVKYDQATCEAKVTQALAVCDGFAASGGMKTGVYSGRWFWTDRRYMGNTTSFAERELWDANYDEIADAALGYAPYGGWQRCVIKQFRGTTVMAGIHGLDLNVLAVDKEAELQSAGPSGSTPTDAQPQSDPPAESETPEEPTRETPDDWQWPLWREAAIQYKAIADSLGLQLAQAQQASAPASA